jgi:hypothetical protein
MFVWDWSRSSTRAFIDRRRIDWTDGDMTGNAIVSQAKIIKAGIEGDKNMSSYVLSFQDIDKTKLMVVGGKGANLEELAKIEGRRVPDGFCLSTGAFQRIIGEAPSIHA